MSSAFYYLDDRGPGWDYEDPYWEVDEDVKVDDAVRAALGKRKGVLEVYGAVQSWDTSTVVRCKPRGPVTDFAIRASMARPFVSLRLRDFLMEHAAGQLQFLPVYMGWRGKVQITEPYFKVVPQVLVDCLDLEASEAKPTQYYSDALDIEYKKQTIDCSRVPENVSIFRLMYRPHLLVVRDALWRRLKKAGFTGVYARAIRTSNAGAGRAVELPVFPEFQPGSAPIPEKRGARPRDLMGLIKYLVKAGEVKVGNGATAKELKALEKGLGIELPPGLRALVKEFGGLDGYGMEVCGVEGGNRGSALKRTAELREYPGIEWPERMVCFAEDGRGGGYVLAERDGVWGVYYWDHEEQGEKRAAKLKKLSGDFEKWLYGVLVKQRLPY